MKRALIKPVDIIIAAAAIVTAIISVFIFGGKDGEFIEISLNGEQVANLPLARDTEYSVGEVTVTVKNGEAYISDSSCKDKICMRSRLKKSGDSAICLPNRVTVTVSGAPDADAVTY